MQVYRMAPNQPAKALSAPLWRRLIAWARGTFRRLERRAKLRKRWAHVFDARVRYALRGEPDWFRRETMYTAWYNRVVYPLKLAEHNAEMAAWLNDGRSAAKPRARPLPLAGPPVPYSM